MWCAGSLLVLVFVLILVLVLILILVAVLILVLILIHVCILRFPVLRTSRYTSIPNFLRFILGLKKQTHQKSCGNGSGNAPGGGFQSTDENTEETHFIHCLPDTLCQQIPKACQGYTGPGTGKFDEGIVDPDPTQPHADNYIADQNSCRSQLCFVYEQLTDDA